MKPQYAALQIDAARKHAIRRSKMQAARFRPPVPAVVAPIEPPAPKVIPIPVPSPTFIPIRDLLFVASEAPEEGPAIPDRYSIRGIIQTIAQANRIPVDSVCGIRRTMDLVKVRQDAMFIAWALTPQSLPQIGRRFGGRDHTTVLHAVHKRCKEYGIFGLPNMRLLAEQVAKRMLAEAQLALATPAPAAMCAEIQG